ncbi:MAG: HEAT repeat domain-containing protein [Phototrophicaceae bacterium]|jgi:HEAT repeat protein
MVETKVTGREPRLAVITGQKGQRRLSLRGVATMLNMLPPEAISLDAAEAALRSEDFFVRYNAAKMLARRGDRDARVTMEKVLKDGEPTSRASVARHLYGFSWFAAEPLIRKALQDADSRVREGAIYALCDLRELNAYKLMVEVLKDEDDNVLQAAAWGLRDTQDSAAIPVLKLVLETAKDPDVRIKALEALGQSDTPEAKPIVRDAMNDAEPEVKYAATLSLLELSGESWLSELSGIIGRTRGETLRQVLRGFFHATNYLKIDVSQSKAADLMIDALETALIDDMPETREAVIWPLAWMRHTRTPGIIRRTYHGETNPRIKAQIVKVATSLMTLESGGNEESERVSQDLLNDALNSSEPEVRFAAEAVVTSRARSAAMSNK